MNWTVEFAPGIWGEALEIWAVCPDLAVARAALGEVKDRLAADPHAAGRHLSEGLWTLTIPPFAVFYAIDPARRYVEITAVEAVS